MQSVTTARFRNGYNSLPLHVRALADKAYRLWKEDPGHQSLRFKKVNPDPPVYSVRISLGYRALGVLDDNTLIWFWIGTHAEYDRLIADL